MFNLRDYMKLYLQAKTPKAENGSEGNGFQVIVKLDFGSLTDG